MLMLMLYSVKPVAGQSVSQHFQPVESRYVLIQVNQLAGKQASRPVSQPASQPAGPIMIMSTIQHVYASVRQHGITTAGRPDGQ